MTVHSPHPDPDGRDEFLVDGCPRCQEYADEMGIHFDPERFRLFWAHMVAVEFNAGAYGSALDKQLGRSLYYVVLAVGRAFALPLETLSASDVGAGMRLPGVQAPVAEALRALQKYDQIAGRVDYLAGGRRLIIEALDALGSVLGLECTGEAEGGGFYDHSGGTCAVHEWICPEDEAAAEALLP